MIPAGNRDPRDFDVTCKTVGAVRAASHQFQQRTVIVRAPRLAFPPIHVIFAVPGQLVRTDDVPGAVLTFVNCNSFTIRAETRLAEVCELLAASG
jgi:hypothetical protein